MSINLKTASVLCSVTMSQVHFHTLKGLGKYMRKTKNELTLTLLMKMTLLFGDFHLEVKVFFINPIQHQLIVTKRRPTKYDLSLHATGSEENSTLLCFMGKLGAKQGTFLMNLLKPKSSK